MGSQIASKVRIHVLQRRCRRRSDGHATSKFGVHWLTLGDQQNLYELLGMHDNASMRADGYD
jgi:hypothetical protein